MTADFEGEVLPHLPALHRAARRLVAESTAAEDLVQDALLLACRSWHQYQPGTNVRAWLMTILRHCHFNHYRKARRAPVLVEFDDTAHTTTATQPLLPASESDRSLTDEKVVAAIRQLRPEYRQALLLSDLDGLPLSEISRRLGIPVGTAKSRIFRARRQARTKLQEHAVAMGYLSDRRPVPALDRPRRIA